MPKWWLKQREVARYKKDSRKPMWQSKPSEEVVTSIDPLPEPHTWYQFCIQQKYVYESLGEHVAAMVYWCLRFIDDDELGSPKDPCTDEGYQDLKDYWAYKMDWFEARR